MSAQIHDPEVARLVEIANRLEHRYVDDGDVWDGSPFEWIRGGLASRRKGVALKSSCPNGVSRKDCKLPNPGTVMLIASSPDCEQRFKAPLCGRMVRTDFSKSGTKNYRILLCMGISPYDAHCWVIPKDDVMRLWDEGIITSQHGGSGGSDTAWIAVNPASPPNWIRPYGGTLTAGFARLRSLVGQI